MEKIIADFVTEVNKIFTNAEMDLESETDFSLVEEALQGIWKRLVASILEKILNGYLKRDSVIRKLKIIGGRFGMRYKEHRRVTVRIFNGEKISVMSPYFLKADKKRGKKKRGPNGRGSHLGLESLGLIGKCSRDFISYVVKLAVLWPSYAVAREVLAEQGIKVDVKTIQRLCRELGELGLEYRGRVSLTGEEDLRGFTVVIGIDGGRLREREKKRGRKKKGRKRQGYHTEWREPKLFTIYLLDKEGKKVEEFSPLHDATMGKHEEAFELLKKYLCQLDLSSAERIVFCGDGGPWIWSDVEALCSELGGLREKVYQVLDYSHAVQNFYEIIESLPKKSEDKREWFTKTCKEMLWDGNIEGLYERIRETFHGKKRNQALKKWRNYFQKNKNRMQYKMYKSLNIPCGSGCVESAIRRVINLRLKSAGSFWLRETAEYFLFLRSQLLSGRWKIFMKNAASRMGKFNMENEQYADDYNEQGIQIAVNF